MMNLVVIVILQLILTIAETKEDFKFGDMIAFQDSCCGKTYNHYAIYVDDKEFKDLKKPDQDIFHFTGPVSPRIADCVFGKLDSTRPHKISNYLDNVFKVGTEDEMINRIRERHRNCSIYIPWSNNCEHLATYVRYGERLALQRGQDTAKYCKNDKKYNITEIMEKLGPIRDPTKTCEELCSKDSSSASS